MQHLAGRNSGNLKFDFRTLLLSRLRLPLTKICRPAFESEISKMNCWFFRQAQIWSAKLKFDKRPISSHYFTKFRLHPPKNLVFMRVPREGHSEFQISRCRNSGEFKFERQKASLRHRGLSATKIWDLRIVNSVTKNSARYFRQAQIWFWKGKFGGRQIIANYFLKRGICRESFEKLVRANLASPQNRVSKFKNRTSCRASDRRNGLAPVGGVYYSHSWHAESAFCGESY